MMLKEIMDNKSEHFLTVFTKVMENMPSDQFKPLTTVTLAKQLDFFSPSGIFPFLQTTFISSQLPNFSSLNACN